MDLSDFLLDRRTAHVKRWHKNATLRTESDAEHHALTARIAFFVAWLVREEVPDSAAVDPAWVATAALFHDEPEVLTGDVPRASKDADPDFAAAVKRLDALAEVALVDCAPESVRDAYRLAMKGCLNNDVERQIVTYADELAALAFVEEEVSAGNRDMDGIARAIRQHVASFDWPWLVALRAEVKGMP